ncbi:class I SAM-dependent methyltransferase [Pseudomonadota bacterium]
MRKNLNTPLVDTLPPASSEAQAHSEKLKEAIHQEMTSANGMLTFARFMELALYAPGLGYYSAGARKFGEEGDFVTAPEISPLFSRCLARQCQAVLQSIGHGDILEFGAGTGTMASDVLLELEQLGTLPGNYFILELSPDLRQRQQETLRRRVPQLFDCIQWLDAMPLSGFKGVVLANEVVDAMPVHLVRFEEQSVREAFVSENKQGFIWQEGPLSTPELQQRIEAVQQNISKETFCPGYTTEINLAQSGWISSIGSMLEQGVALIIDYGFPEHEYYHEERTMGTLMCHYRHHAHPDPLILPGLQDITSHVDFTALATTAVEAGLDVMGYTSQAQFLLGCGIGEIIAEADPEDTRPYLELTQQVKKLTLPSEMGELFKVIAFGREVDIPLNGFMMQDRRHAL